VRVDFASKHMLARERYVKDVDVPPKIPGCRELLFTWQYNVSVAEKEVSKVLRPYSRLSGYVISVPCLKCMHSKKYLLKIVVPEIVDNASFSRSGYLEQSNSR
jgi:hypothetical protein